MPPVVFLQQGMVRLSYTVGGRVGAHRNKDDPDKGNVRTSLAIGRSSPSQSDEHYIVNDVEESMTRVGERLAFGAPGSQLGSCALGALSVRSSYGVDKPSVFVLLSWVAADVVACQWGCWPDG